MIITAQLFVVVCATKMTALETHAQSSEERGEALNYEETL